MADRRLAEYEQAFRRILAVSAQALKAAEERNVLSLALRLADEEVRAAVVRQTEESIQFVALREQLLRDGVARAELDAVQQRVVAEAEVVVEEAVVDEVHPRSGLISPLAMDFKDDGEAPVDQIEEPDEEAAVEADEVVDDFVREADIDLVSHPKGVNISIPSPEATLYPLGMELTGDETIRRQNQADIETPPASKSSRKSRA